VVAVEARSALLELGESSISLSARCYRTDVWSPTPRRRGVVDPVTELVWTDGADRVRGGVRLTVGVAAEAGDSYMGFRAAPVVRQAELLARILSDWQSASDAPDRTL
jgi:hypothetical protein